MAAHLRLGVESATGEIQVDVTEPVEPCELARAQVIDVSRRRVGRMPREKCGERGFPLLEGEVPFRGLSGDVRCHHAPRIAAVPSFVL